MTSPSASSQTASLAQSVMDVVRLASDHPEVFNRLSEEIKEAVSSSSAFHTSSEYCDLLQNRYNLLRQPTDITEGMLMQWKAGLKNKSRPAYGEPCIVIQFLKTPEFDVSFRSSSAYFREPLDLQIGVLDDDRELQLYYVDSRRFTTFNGPESVSPVPSSEPPEQPSLEQGK